MTKIQNIIWDWNGTLVDDGCLFVELINRVLKKRKLKEISLNIYQEKFCFPLEEYYSKLGFNFNIEPYEVPSMEFVRLYNKNKYRPLLYSGATNLLKKICDLGIKNYLLSAQNQTSLIDLVKFYELEQYFTDIRGTNNFHARGKFETSKEMLKNVGPHNSFLFIGDTNMDMDIAKQHASPAIAIGFGHQLKTRFKKSKNIKLVNSFKDLDSLILSKLKGYL